MKSTLTKIKGKNASRRRLKKWACTVALYIGTYKMLQLPDGRRGGVFPTFALAASSVHLFTRFSIFINYICRLQFHLSYLNRTPSQCYKQATVLVVEENTSELCERPKASIQQVDAGLTGLLSCPLRRYSKRVDSYSIQWYKVNQRCIS